jgi:tRNA pseudouridine55 synthase
MSGGVLNLCKPVGLSSHDLVDQVRRVLRVKRVGHGGTLDPFATGVLLVGFGAATKALPYLSDLAKEYEAVLLLGVSTTTLDVEGEVTATQTVPPLDEAEIARTLQGFLGPQEQLPPTYSALKVGGVRAYRLARQGVEVALPPRTITVERIELLAWDPPRVTFRALVSKGTYLRRLAADIAARLGTGGHLVSLTRTAVGGHGLATSLTLDDVCRAAAAKRVGEIALTLPAALGHLRRVRLDAEGARQMSHGIYPAGHFVVEEGAAPGELLAAVSPEGMLAAVVRGGGAPTHGGSPAFVIERVFRG